MDPAIIAAIIGAGAASTSAGVSAAGNFRSLKKNMKATKFAADLNMANFKEQNIWSSMYLPKLQMMGYKEAGLNPFLVADKGTSAVGSAGHVSAPDVPDYARSYNDAITAGISSSLQALNGIMSAKKTQTDIDYVNQQKRESEAREANLRQQTASELWRYNNIFNLNKSYLDKQVNNMIQRNFLLSLQSQNQAIHNELDKYNLDFMMPLKFENLRWNTEHAKYQFNFLDPAQRFYLLSAANVNNARRALLGSQTTEQDIKNKYAGTYWSSHAASELQKYNYLFNTGVEQPGNLKFLGIPYGNFSVGAGNLLDRGLDGVKYLFDQIPKPKLNFKGRNNHKRTSNYYGLHF